MAEVRWSKGALEDRDHWRKEEPRTYERIERLLADIAKTPFRGVGKPEPLKHALSVFWSRRLNEDHRMVYRVEGDQLQIAQLRLHD